VNTLVKLFIAYPRCGNILKPQLLNFFKLQNDLFLRNHIMDIWHTAIFLSQSVTGLLF